MEKIEKEKNIFGIKDFTKIFINQLLTRYIIVGFLSFILIDTSVAFFPDAVNIVVLLLVAYLTIKKIHLDSISNTFALGKINTNDIDVIKKRIVVVYCFIAFFGVVCVFLWYIFSTILLEYMDSHGMIIDSLIGTKESIESSAIRNLLVNIIIQIIGNAVFALVSVGKFKKESSKIENIV